MRIRVANDSDKLGIDVQGTAENPIYVVTGIVESRDELVPPGGRYRRGDMARLAQWLKDLAERGPNARKEEKAAFGLSASQFSRVRKDLAAPVGFSTQGMTCRQVVEKIAGRLAVPLKLDAETARTLADDKVENELTELTCGTALACALRASGYGLVPRNADGQIAYVVVKLDRDVEAWPVGWELSDQSPRDALPVLYEFHNVNLTNVPAATALEAIAKLVKSPMLIDRFALRGTESTWPRRRCRFPTAGRRTV